MFYWLAELSDTVSVFNVFRYITFRTGGAVVTALIFVFLFGPSIIAMLRVKQGKGQPIRTDGPKSPLITKVGTLTLDWDGSSLTVSYDLKAGYVMQEAHIYAADAPPLTVAPGQYGFTAYFDPESTYFDKTFSISDPTIPIPTTATVYLRIVFLLSLLYLTFECSNVKTFKAPSHSNSARFHASPAPNPVSAPLTPSTR